MPKRKGAPKTKAEGAKSRKKAKVEAITEESEEVDYKGAPGCRHMLECGTILERGHIYFLYRPKVEHKTASGTEEVQRLYILLVPGHLSSTPSHKPTEETKDSGILAAADATGSEAAKEPEKAPEEKAKEMADSTPLLHMKSEHNANKRLIIVGHKALPSGHAHERRWAMVDKVSRHLSEIDHKLEKATYSTRTRGKRHLEGARPVGAGIYALVRHGNHTHLAYVLETPHTPGEVQHDLHIEHEGNFIISVKNPQAPPSFTFRSASKKVKLPKNLQSLFGERRFASLETPELLDHEGVELLLIGARDDLGDLGHAGKEIEKAAEGEEAAGDLSPRSIYHQLRLHAKESPVEPLHGEWEE